jgi:dolichol kinase
MSDKFEIKRKIFHVIFGITLVFLLYYEIINNLILLIIIIIGLIVSFLSRKIKIPIVYWFLKKFERDGEIRKFPGKGIIFYLMGAYIVFLFFPKDIASASLVILAFGDSFSHLVGKHFGTLKHPFTDKKFLEGAVAGIIAGFFAAIIFVSPFEAFLASFFGMLVEGIDLKLGIEKVDDNIVVPIASAVIIYLIRLL